MLVKNQKTKKTVHHRSRRVARTTRGSAQARIAALEAFIKDCVTHASLDYERANALLAAH